MMKRLVIVYLCLGFLFSCDDASKDVDYARYVNVFIGTQHEGHCFPGATAPLGMVQPSPETYNEYYPGYEMDHVAGYQYNDPWIIGFTQTHLNGAGCPSMSDILLLPYCENEIDPSLRSNFKSTYDKEKEYASPGYYNVYLNDHHVNVELTASERVAYHRYTFDRPESAKLLIDLQYGVSWDINSISENILEATQEFEDAYTFSGYRKAREWAHRDLYYVLKFSRKIVRKDSLTPPEGKDEKAPRYIVEFDMEDGDQLEVLLGVSTVGIAEAKANLEAEIDSRTDFDDVRKETEEKWNAILSKIEIEGGEDQKSAFYTSMYHLYIQPNNIADVDGRFRNKSNDVMDATGGAFYSTLSLWDTYRAANPMYTILSPELVSGVLTSMLDSYSSMVVDPENPKEANRYLPRWQLWAKETHTMVANHAVPVFVDAYLKGIKAEGYSDEEMFDAIWNSVSKLHYRNHVTLIDSFGYIPYDVQLSSVDDSRETVSRLLEGIYDDYCAGLLAREMGKEPEAGFLERRAGYFRNIYDSESGFMRGKDSKGVFKKDVDLSEVVGEWLAESDFTEGNAYHYQFHVQHDIPGLCDLMGGKAKFAENLDSIFYSSSKPEVKTLVWNIHGTIGQYWHGNEPCHHVPYLYKYTDEPEKTDRIIRKLADEFYLNKADGLKGNDDCGQMSAWYMFASLGFYPVNPCGGEYILGAPQVREAQIHLPNGKVFTVKAENLSEENCIVRSVRLNGEVLDRNFIRHREIIDGGELIFEMG